MISLDSVTVSMDTCVGDSTSHHYCSSTVGVPRVSPSVGKACEKQQNLGAPAPLPDMALDYSSHRRSPLGSTLLFRFFFNPSLFPASFWFHLLHSLPPLLPLFLSLFSFRFPLYSEVSFSGPWIPLSYDHGGLRRGLLNMRQTTYLHCQLLILQ